MGEHKVTQKQGRLKAWRERMGYSQREACEQLGCSREAWSGWEADETKAPKYIGLACAALALGMTGFGLEGKDAD